MIGVGPVGCLMTISVGVFFAAIWAFIGGNWQLGLILLAADFIIATIGGLMMGPPRG